MVESNKNSNAPAGSFSFIPDATITGDTVSGARGTLDVGDIYFQTGGYDPTGNGIVYFNTQGRQIGAAGTAAGITTSNFVLTTNAAGIPKWTTTLDGGTF